MILKAALLALLCLGISTGCASNKVIREPGTIKTILLYPPIPYEKLTCILEPAAPASEITQEAFAEWAERVRQAGQDCRGNLDFLRAYVLTWESKVDQSDIWVEEGDDY